MKKVHFLASKENLETFFLDPIRLNQKELKERGYKINIFYAPTSKSMSCDILCILSKALIKMLNEKESVFQESGPIINFLCKARERTDKIIWMDTSDSTGVTHFEILDFVDLYLKKQLLKDRALYQKEFYGGRIFTDYYHEKYLIEDKEPFNQFFPLKSKLNYKVDISWNISLADVYTAANMYSVGKKIEKYFIDYLPKNYNFLFFSPKTYRNNDFLLKKSRNIARDTVLFHTTELSKRLRQLVNKDPNINGLISDKHERLALTDKSQQIFINKKDSFKAYKDLLRQSKIVVGPFSYGDINLRDYEAILHGATLLKPNIDYLETWPPILVKGETYKDFKWDFEDIEYSILTLLNNSNERLRIATNAQDLYRSYTSKDGMEKFCDWFIHQIEK